VLTRFEPSSNQILNYSERVTYSHDLSLITGVMSMHSEQLQKAVLVLADSLITDRVRKLAEDLAPIPSVQIWVEDKNEVRIGVVPAIFQGIGSDLITYSKGWLTFKKPSVVRYLSETVRVTIFYFPSHRKEVEQVLQKSLSSLPVLEESFSVKAGKL